MDLEDQLLIRSENNILSKRLVDLDVFGKKKGQSKQSQKIKFLKQGRKLSFGQYMKKITGK
jgi:hypothetical protein